MSADDRGVERSSVEIKTLVRKLHPRRGNHKDRQRQLNKFRNYVIGSGGKLSRPPEFYDDDLVLLWLGSAAPAAYLEEVNDDVLALGIFGLLQACGAPSEDHDGTLKRSARIAMNVLKWLLLDWKDSTTTSTTTTSKADAANTKHQQQSINLFARSFLSLEVKHYHHMQLDLHCIGDDRGGAKEDACQILVLILTNHTTEDGESIAALAKEDILRSTNAREKFKAWMIRNCTRSTQEAIKKNAIQRHSEHVALNRQDAVSTKASHNDWEHRHTNEHVDVESPLKATKTGDMLSHTPGQDWKHDKEKAIKERDNSDDDSDDDDHDDDDVVATIRKRSKQLGKDFNQEEGLGGDILSRDGSGNATRWKDSQVAREQRARAASAAKTRQHHATVRDTQQVAHEILEREEERAKVLGKDPLGIITTDDFDLPALASIQAQQLETALAEAIEETQKAETTADEKTIKNARNKKESIEALIERLGGIETMKDSINLERSILPTNPTFDPLLFLTVAHRKTTFETLKGSMEKLSNEADDKVKQMQSLVLDNFPLFVRCAEGFEQFRKSSENEVGLGLNERVDKLEGIAESCAFQAKKSFKPLLDNTSEVRKVQSAMSVLQRVSPVLQVPALMRQHIDNRRYSDAIKTYRRVLVIDKTCKIEILNRMRSQAEELVLDARRALENRLAQELAQVSVDGLIEAIRDLDELLQLTEVPVVDTSLVKPSVDKKLYLNSATSESREIMGIFDLGGHVISVREHPPALACLLLQAAHFTIGVHAIVEEADINIRRIFSGEKGDFPSEDTSSLPSVSIDDTKSSRMTGNQWKYDILDARVISTIKIVSFARLWLPRLIRVARSAREDEKRRVARIGIRRFAAMNDNHLTAFEVFLSNIAPSITLLVEHAAFCSLGSTARSNSKEIVMTFGKDASERLRSLLCSPLPPTQCTKASKELSELMILLSDCSDGAASLRPDRDSSVFKIAPLYECKNIGDAAVLTIEKRRCIYAFDVCSRSCVNRASGSGKFDALSLLNCLKTLAEQLSRPSECSVEVEKGCELVVRRCCEGLASYVRDRGDDARLNAVSECANVMTDRISEIIASASCFAQNSSALEVVLTEDVLGLESAIFDEYLENIRADVAGSIRVGWLDSDAESLAAVDGNAAATPTFPAYLSSSLLAIVRCRAQVEQSLGDKVRVSEGVTYQHLAMTTVAEGVVDAICKEIMDRKSTMKIRQADRLANELEFLKSTLKKFLGEEILSYLDSTLQVAASRAGRGRNYQGNGPDGLAALEELERLGRVYVLCLGE